MTTPTTAELLKYADLQMAAEAFIRDPDTQVLHPSGQELIDSLKAGNKHASRFTDTQAIEFAKHWEVLDQRANSSTGFSGTLFRCKITDPSKGLVEGQVVMSFRSTEFLDDAARDNKATNVLEIKETGFAWGQIADMEDWYANLVLNGKLTQPFSVTGYSLGGHLATVFNQLHPSAAQQVVTFNGAGVGGVKPTTTLQTLVDRFSTLAKNASGTEFQFEDSNLAAIYARTRNAINSASHTGTISMADNLALRDIVEAPTTTLQTQRQAQMVLDAVNRINNIRDEVVYLQGITSGVANQPPPKTVEDGEIGQENLDYQMAVLTVKQDTDASGLVAGLSRAYQGKQITTRVALNVATDLIAAYACQTGVNGRFGCESNHLRRWQARRRLRWHAQDSTCKSIHARSMRLAGQKWLGRRMDSAWRVL